MSYIRTKLNTIHQVREYVGSLIFTNSKVGLFDYLVVKQEEVVKKSDNIEDLFDLLITENKKRKILSVDKDGVITYADNDCENENVYGAMRCEKQNFLQLVAFKNKDSWELLNCYESIH